MKACRMLSWTVLFWVASQAAAAAPPAPQGLGQLLIQDAQSQSPVRLNISRYHVHVVLQPPVALVQIDQSFYNPFDRQQEGQFVFNLPPGASVSRFAMYVTPTQLIEGELIERQRAAQVYQTIVSRRRDPAILEQIGDNLFKMRVFPVFARDEKRILLDYTLPLEMQAGQYQFRLPLLSDLSPIWDFRITGMIPAAVRPQSPGSVSHPAMTFPVKADGAVAFEFHKKEYRPETDLVVSFAAPPDAAPALRSYVAAPLPAREGAARDAPPADEWSQKKATYFLAQIPPAAHSPAAPPADVFILADTSSSIADLTPVRRAVRDIVDRLRPQDRVRLVCGDGEVRPLHKGWIEPRTAAAHDKTPAGKRSKRARESVVSPPLAAALQQLDAQFALGGTDLDGCLREALASFEGAPGARRRLVIYVGDGADDSGRPRDSAAWKMLAEWLEQAQVSFVGVIVQGPVAAQKNMAQLAVASGGLVFDLAGDVLASRRLARWLSAGLPAPKRVRQATVAGAAADDVYCPAAWLPGEPLYVYGRMPEGREVRLSLTLGRGSQQRTQTFTLAVPSGQDDVFVGRLWAQRRLEQWLRRDLQKDEETRKRVLALSQEWSLLSPYTAFLVLESEQDYGRWNIDRRTRRRYWKPADARPEEPLPPSWVDRVTPRNKRKAATELFAPTLEKARAAADAGRYAQALQLLLEIKGAPQAKAGEYVRLRERAQAGLRSREFVESLGLHRGLLDPAAAAGWELRPSVMSLFGGACRADPEFLRRHPYAEKLLQDVDLAVISRTQTLGQLAETLRQRTGANVTLDRKALSDVGVDSDTRLETQGVRKPRPAPSTNPFAAAPRPGGHGGKPARKVAEGDPFAQPADPFGPAPAQAAVQPAQPAAGTMSLRSLVRHRLRPLGLVLVEEPHRLLITTPEGVPLTTEVYPVADLLFTDRLAPPELLSHPLVDGRETARRRIETKLKQPLTINYLETPLEDVADHLADRLGEPVLLDATALDDVGVDRDAPVTQSYRDVPAKKALEWLLHDLGLRFTIWDEAVVITSSEQADARMEVSLHSGHGLLYEYPVPADAAARWQQQLGLGAQGFGRGGGAMVGRGGRHGLGGGMAGMGGGMGGMGGTFGGEPSSPAVTGVVPPVDGGNLAGTAGLSTGGEGTVASPKPAARAVPEADMGGMPGGSAGGAAKASVAYDYDADTLIDLTTSTIAPTSWDSVGGPGSIQFFPETLDFVFAQTREVHEQVAELFDRLRRLPPQVSAQSGARPATVHPPVVDDFTQADFDTLIDVITSVLGPPTWDSVGGPGSIAAEPTRTALVVSQTPDMHEELERLLLLLRRSRYENGRGGRPWEAELGPKACGPAAAKTPVADASEPRPPAGLPEAALRFRHDPVAGRWQWRRVAGGGTKSEITVRRAGPLLEFRLGSAIVRTEGDVADVAWPGLKLVEHGRYAEVLRRALDAQLPWLPHRSNEELSRLFEVFEAQPNPSAAQEAAQEQETDRRGPAGHSAVWLRLVPAGLPRDGDTYLQIAYSRSDRLPMQWEAYVAGKRTGRIRFENRIPDGAQPEWPTAVLEDASGRELVRWEWIEAQADGGAIPELTSGWDGCLHLDCRAEKPVLDAPFREALVAVRDSRWERAAELLSRLPEEIERHPLVRLLRAWCLEHDPRLGPPALLRTLLGEVVQSDAVGLRAFLAEGNFRSLSETDRYALLSLQPEIMRTGVDYDRLAVAAAAVEKLPEALRHIDAALQRGAHDGRSAVRRRLRIELLLRLGRSREAQAEAEDWSVPGRTPPDETATVAELFAAHAQPVMAEKLFRAALADSRLAAAQRYWLLRRWAAVRQGGARCETLFEALTLQPAGAPERRACLEVLRQELATPAHAETAGRLAARTKDAELAAELLIRQAELTKDRKLASDLAWRVHQSGRLDDTRLRLVWACQVWRLAGQPDRAIQACEALLRAGRSLSPPVLDELAQAYVAAERPQDARRAVRRDTAPAPPAPVGQPTGPTGPAGPPGMGGMF